MHSSKPTHTYPYPPTPSQKKVTPTNTHLHPAKKRSHPPTLTNNQPEKGHTDPHPPTPSPKKVTKGHTHPHPPTTRLIMSHPAKRRSYPPTHNWKKECHVSNTYVKYSLFTILPGVFIFEKDWPVQECILSILVQHYCISQRTRRRLHDLH